MIDQKQFSHQATFINLIFYKDLLADIKDFFSFELKCQRETHVLRSKRGQRKQFGATCMWLSKVESSSLACSKRSDSGERCEVKKGKH